jgi:multiple sugar transport system permease protein
MKTNSNTAVRRSPHDRLEEFYRKHKLNRWLLFVITLLFTFVFLFPVFWMMRMSITPTEDLFKIPPKWIPDTLNLEGFKYFAHKNFQRFFYNSLIVSFSTVIVCIFSGVLSAYSFSRFDYRGRRTLMVITLSAQMFPWTLLIITLYIFFIKVRLLDTYFGIVLAHTTFALPLTIWIIKSYFDTIPKELEESAYIDGCGLVGALVKIILPLSYPGILAAAIYVFIFSWNDFLFGLTLASKNNMRILAPGIAISFIGEFEYRWVEMMACSIIVTLPVAILFLLLQRYFIQGLTAGALKE